MSLAPDLSRKRKTPLVLAAETAECGLACLTMVAIHFGHRVDLNGLRQRFTTSNTGATLRSLMTAADSLHLAPRALRVELHGLKKLRLPAILHWDLSHFVVLKKVSGRSAIVLDPGLGARTLTLEEVSRHFTGVVLEFLPLNSFEPIEARTPVTLRSLWTRSHGLWSAVGQIVVLSVALQAVVFLNPFQLQLVIDEGVLQNDTNVLTVLALGFAGVVIVQSLLEWLRGWALQVVSHTLSYQMVGNVIHHILRLPAEYFERRHVGDVLSRLGSSTAIQNILTQGVLAVLMDGVMGVVALTLLAIYSPALTAIVVVSMLMMMVIATGLFPFMRRRTEEEIVERAKEQSHLIETIRAISTIKIMGRETEREGAWRNFYGGVINASISTARYRLSLASLQTLIVGLQLVAVLYVGSRLVISNQGLSLGMLVAFLSFRQTFNERVIGLINQSLQFRFIALHLERLADVIHIKAEDTTPISAGHPVPGGIVCRKLGFQYSASEPMVLADLDLEVEPGEFLAITGPSGGGKTTLIKLLLGLREPTQGYVELDGLRATSSLWRAWRESVGVVSQEDKLLSGSIAENIAFFDPDLCMEKVWDAAKAARIHKEIMRMPMQYLSLVGDMGSALSGGQKQRVLLARALYRSPKVLILDEGTANLDLVTEEAIAELISALPMTRIVVAHRPALVRRADRVVTVAGGKLVSSARPSVDLSPKVEFSPWDRA